MTVSSETNKASYDGNDSTTDFSTGFVFLEDSHVLVTLVNDTTGVETPQTITTHYTLTGAGTGSAGTVTMLTAPATGETLIVSRNIPLTQGADYVENDPFPAATHEEGLDKLTMIAQQQQEELDRSLRFPLSVDSGVSNEIPTPTADYYLKFNSAGTAIEAIALAENIAEITYENLDANGDVGFGSGQVPAGNLTMPLSKIGVTAGDVVQVDQALTVTTRSATTTLGTSLNHTLSDTSTTITAFNGVAGVTYHCRALGAGNITHHATNLIITQTGADITTAAGDTFDVEMITSTTCRIKNYVRAVGPITAASQAEMEAGTETALRTMSPERVKQAIDALGGSGVTIGTPQATTSGTNKDFTIPAGTKKVTVSVSGLSFATNTNPLIELGDSGGIVTTGYSGNVQTAGTSNANLSSGFALITSGTSTDVYHGSLELILLDSANYIWAAFGVFGRSDAAQLAVVAGTVTLTGELTTVRLTSSGGATMDAGSCNVAYQ